MRFVNSNTPPPCARARLIHTTAPSPPHAQRKRNNISPLSMPN
jgi:hypothetical protein